MSGGVIKCLIYQCSSDLLRLGWVVFFLKSNLIHSTKLDYIFLRVIILVINYSFVKKDEKTEKLKK